MLLAELGEDEAAARVDAGIRSRDPADEVDARRRDGLLHLRGRRPGRRGGRSMSLPERPDEGAQARPEGSASPYDVELYDTTLRDGAQAPGLSYSVEDRMRILHKLDQLGCSLHRGRLARRQPARHRVLQARHEGDARALGARRLRDDPPGGRARRGLRDAARAAGRRNRDRLLRRQELGSARDEGAPHRSRRGRRDGGRHRAVPSRAGTPRVLRRRALLRRLPGEPRLRARRAARRPGRGRRASRAVRHERRCPADARSRGS